MKRIRFHNSVEKELATLSEEVRIELAEALGLLARDEPWDASKSPNQATPISEIKTGKKRLGDLL